MKVIVKAKNKQHYDTLQPLVKPLTDMLSHLKNTYGFKLPVSLILQPLIRVNTKCPLLPFANAGHSSIGYFISMNLRVPKLKELRLRTLGHEAAHVAEALLTGRWTHGDLFNEMEEKTQTFITRRCK